MFGLTNAETLKIIERRFLTISRLYIYSCRFDLTFAEWLMTKNPHKSKKALRCHVPVNVCIVITSNSL